MGPRIEIRGDKIAEFEADPDPTLQWGRGSRSAETPYVPDEYVSHKDPLQWGRGSRSAETTSG